MTKAMPTKYHHVNDVDSKTIERFKRAKLVKQSDCLLWIGSTDKSGYGRVGNIGAHRLAYLLERGEIEPGMLLDHLCRNRACCNPHHLEPVTPQENVRRGDLGRLRTHCKNGHEYNAENTHTLARGSDGYPRRQCRKCANEKRRSLRAA